MKWISPGLVAGNRLATFRLWGRCHEVCDHIPYRGAVLPGDYPLADPAGTEGRGHMAISAGKEGLL